MRIQSISNINFGIYQSSKIKLNSNYTWGIYKGKKIEIYENLRLYQKLQCVSNYEPLQWVKSKLKYIENGVKKIIESERKQP